MVVVIAEIRTWPLNGIPISDITDAALAAALAAATLYINGVKKATATNSQIDTAIRCMAGYMAYAGKMGYSVNNVAGSFSKGYFVPSRGTSDTPIVDTDTRAQLRALKELADLFMSQVSEITDAGNTSWTPPKDHRIPFVGSTRRLRDL